MISITTPCRLHLSLIDLNGSLGRIDGSIGISLEKPNVVVEIKKGSFSVKAGIRSEELSQLASRISRKFNLRNDFILNVRSQIPLHSGLGSTTQLYLAAAKAILKLNGIEMNASELAVLTGRGGTSGIGVAAFDKGGFIVDCGHSYGKGKDKIKFMPSSFSKAKTAPVACRLDFPNWDVILCTPKFKGLHGVDELNYFKQHFPAEEKEAEKISRIILMKLIPSILEKNLDEFDRAVTLLNKARSFRFPKETQKIINEASRQGGMGTSMTSFGPTVFTFTDNKKTKERIKQKLKQYGRVTETKALNHGALVKRT